MEYVLLVAVTGGIVYYFLNKGNGAAKLTLLKNEDIELQKKIEVKKEENKQNKESYEEARKRFTIKYGNNSDPNKP
jgi:hypothetical protein